MDATTVAVDLAKDVFEVATANRAGRIVERKRLTRRQFEAFVDALPAGYRVVMEACGTAHYWGRRCQARGHDVQLLPVQYVKPYVRRNKTDRMDTDALLEAARCAGIQPVPVKTPEQQALQALHRVRTQWQRTRTARINTLRGMLREHGMPIALGARTVLAKCRASWRTLTMAYPRSCAPTLALVYDEVRALERDIDDIDRQLGARRCSGSGRPTPPHDSGHRRHHRDGASRRRCPHPRVSPRPAFCELARTDTQRALERFPPSSGSHQ